MSKILVTGATGNVGKYVTEYLLVQEQSVKAAGMHEKRPGACLEAPPHHKIEKMLRESGIPWCFVRQAFLCRI